MDERALFEQVYKNKKKTFSWLISNIIRDPQEIEDILNEAFLRAWKCRGQYRGEAQLATWINRIIINTAINYRQHRKSEPLNDYIFLTVGLEPLDEQNPEHILSVENKTKLILGHLKKMPLSIRGPVILNLIYGYKTDEVGHILNIGQRRARNRIFEFKKYLKDLDGYEHD